MVLAADDVRDLGVEVVDRDREVVEDAAVGAGDDGVVHVHVLEGGVAADEVVDDGLALVGHAQAHGAVGLRLAAEAAVGAVLRLVGLDVVGRRGRAVGVAGVEQALQDLLVAIGARDLRDRPLVVVDLQPAQRVEDLLDVLGRRALAVGVLDAQDQRAALAARDEPVVERRARAADVQLSRRAGGEANAHRPQPRTRTSCGSPIARASRSRASQCSGEAYLRIGASGTCPMRTPWGEPGGQMATKRA